MKLVEEELKDRETSIQRLQRKVEALVKWRALAENDLKQREEAKNEMEAKHKWRQKVRKTVILYLRVLPPSSV